MVNNLHYKIRVNDGFDVLKVMTLIQDTKEDKEHGKPPKKFEDVELQPLFDEDNSFLSLTKTTRRAIGL